MYSANVICLQPLLVDLLECVALIECSYMWSYFGSQLLSIAFDWQDLFKGEEISSRSFQSSCDCVEQTLEMCDGLGGATSGILLHPYSPLHAPLLSLDLGDTQRGLPLHAPLLTLGVGTQRGAPSMLHC